MAVMRHVAGTFDTGQQDPTQVGWKPRGSAQLPASRATGAVWAVGFEDRETSTVSAPGGRAELLTAGCCLATEAERHEAVEQAGAGRWHHAARLPGSYLTVIRSGEQVRVIGDRAATVVVHWLLDGGTVLWSTSALALAAYRQAEPDLARVLAAFTVRGADLLGEHSCFTGVNRVPPGRALVLEPGRAPRTEPLPPAGPLDFATGAGLLEERLTVAVERRALLPGRLSADLSGGIDSSTLTALAAQFTDLLAITFTDRHMQDEDDGVYARRIAADYPAVTHRIVHGDTERVHQFDGLAGPLPVTDSPSLSVGLLAVKRAQLAPAHAWGSGVHLTGRGGDDVLDAIPMSILDLYRAGHRIEAGRRLAAFARERRCSTTAVLRQTHATLRTPYGRALDALADTISGRAPLDRSQLLAPWESLSWCGTLPAAAWLTRDGRARVAALLTTPPESGSGPAQLHERLFLERMGEEHATYDQIARQLFQVPVHAPFLDSQVVDLCHAVPGWQRRIPGDFKPIARAAFTGRVPGYLLGRRTKTAMTRTVATGLRANAPFIRALFNTSLLAGAGLIDPRPARAALEAALRGEPAALACLHYLIATELWLATIPTGRDTWWEPIEEHEEITW
ncbi:asparagine synthase-related protein [Kitasatospora sp. NPDC098663]|uniref:asparagine synthase-related protein n=1 Tax=Kitasatospora sp. NPDC098663 TaxID=3364096 RepID=UPI0037F48994